MLKVIYRVDGQTVSPEQLPVGIEQTVVTQIRRIVLQEVGELRCPEHDESPRSIEVWGDSRDAAI